MAKEILPNGFVIRWGKLDRWDEAAVYAALDGPMAIARSPRPASAGQSKPQRHRAKQPQKIEPSADG